MLFLHLWISRTFHVYNEKNELGQFSTHVFFEDFVVTSGDYITLYCVPRSDTSLKFNAIIYLTVGLMKVSSCFIVYVKKLHLFLYHFVRANNLTAFKISCGRIKNQKTTTKPELRHFVIPNVVWIKVKYVVHSTDKATCVYFRMNRQHWYYATVLLFLRRRTVLVSFSILNNVVIRLFCRRFRWQPTITQFYIFSFSRSL